MAFSALFKKRSYWLTVVWSIICSLLLIQLLITEGLRPELFTVRQIVVIPLVRWIVGLGLIFLLVLPVYRFLQGRSLFLQVLGFVGAGLIFSLIYVGLGLLIIQGVEGPIQREAFLIASIEGFLSNLHHIITYYLMLLAVLLAIDYLREKVEAVQSRKRVEQELAETRLQVLKSQLQPHFLFNALNSVTSILEEKPEVAQDMLVDISTLLRTSLRIDLHQLIPLKKELEILQTYLNIEKRRFEHQLEWSVDLDPAAGAVLVPPFMLQPLVENAIKHGYREGVGILKVKILVFGSEHQIGIEIANNGAALTGYTPQLGLNSVRERLKRAYGDRMKFTLFQRADWVINQIEIAAT